MSIIIYLIIFINGSLSTKYVGVKIGETFSEKFIISTNKLLNKIIDSGDLSTTKEKSFTG
jgi:hypothetical protein